jgi:SAM-dependent methyltransferase
MQRFNTPEGALKVFSIYFREMERHGFDLRGKTVLNIGSGDLIGLDALFLLFGAARVVSVDLDPGQYLYPEIHEQRAFYEELARLLPSFGHRAPSEPWDGILERQNGRSRYNADRLHRIAPCDAASLPLRDRSMDFVFSNAVLEHVRNPEGLIHEIARVLSPRGHTMHRVDLRDHQDFTNPLEFLKPDVPANGCNLWRASHFEQAFRASSFRVRRLEIFDTCEVKEKDRTSYRHPFCNFSLEELGKLRIMVYATIRSDEKTLESVVPSDKSPVPAGEIHPEAH